MPVPEAAPNPIEAVPFPERKQLRDEMLAKLRRETGTARSKQLGGVGLFVPADQQLVADDERGRAQISGRTQKRRDELLRRLSTRA